MRRQRTVGIALIVVSLMALVGVAAATLSAGVTVTPIGVATIARDSR